ncbi:MAG: class I SAM-dependent methyltransferase [Acidimicrobiia bacterium]|nr:class I SAM-dependent methyltransferase [Acidimicrobiia bacterium]
MHRTSMLKMAAFRDAYLAPGTHPEPLRVLDLGSMAYGEQASYRPLFAEPRFDYVGVDLAAGPNVDLVLDDPHCWSQIPDGSVDVVVSGQALEHDPQFWITLAEIARVLRADGLCCLVAPSGGPAHRFPLDCWRFYPDAAGAMFTYVGLELCESAVEHRTWRRHRGVVWRDTVAIGRQPQRDDAAAARHRERMAAIVATRCPVPVPPTPGRDGPALDRYHREGTAPWWLWRPYGWHYNVARTKFLAWDRSPAPVRKLASRLMGGAPDA